MSLIGLKCKRGDTFSLQVLIGRGLFLFTSFPFVLASHYALFPSKLQYSVGAYGNEVTPVPIPNTEVKLIRVDDTWLVTARETRSVPTLKGLLFAVLFYFLLPHLTKLYLCDKIILIEHFCKLGGLLWKKREERAGCPLFL